MKSNASLELDENKENDNNIDNSDDSDISREIGNKSRKKNNEIPLKLNKPRVKKRKNNRRKGKEKEDKTEKSENIVNSSNDSNGNEGNFIRKEGISNTDILTLTNEMYCNDYNLNPKRSVSKLSIGKNYENNLDLSRTASGMKGKKGKGKITDKNRKDQENRLLLTLSHTDPQYKRRKIKISSNRQCDIYEFTNKIENNVNFKEEVHEMGDLKKIWSKSENTLTENELNNYKQPARLFWKYKNPHLEEDSCTDFFNYCDRKIKEKNKERKINESLRKKINTLIEELKKIVARGINLYSHCDEISLKMLHLCKYKTNVALFCLYKGLNPFIEEIEGGFKHDLCFFQDEIKSFILNGDLYEDDNK